jgi:thiamine-phosphate pyrophosphorylase
LRSGKLRDKLKLYVITDSRFVNDVKGAELALRGGATAVQMRIKNEPTRVMVEKGKRIRELCDEYNALFIVNDRVDVALATDADGIHLGKEDMRIEDARRIAPNLIIGATTHSIDEILEAQNAGADYIGCGAVFPTKTKKVNVVGLDGLKRMRSVAKIPCVAIGGINAENASDVLSLGVDGIAVLSAIMGAEDIEEAARKIRRIVDEFL